VSTRIIFVRHAETPGSLERRFTGSTDVPLTDEGVKQARALAQRLRQVRIDAIHVSPLTRCLQTAEPITDVTGRKVTVVEDLRECSFGCMENLTLQEALDQFGDKLGEWLGTEDRCPPEGETWVQVGERLKRWFAEASERYKDRTVLAVTHGGPVLWMSRHITGAPHEAMAVFDIDPASVTLFQSRGDRWRLRLFNDVSHLRDPLLDTQGARRNLPA
jgi:broad specificity phosphatase PhoE